MAEGLSPMEAGKKLHEHGESAQEQSRETTGRGQPHERHSLENPHAPPGPTYMPQYKLPQQAQANALDSTATAKFNSGSQAGSIADNYVRITVFLAAVLFLVGIGSSFRLHTVRYGLVAFGSALLVVSIVLIAQQPGLPA